MGANIASEVAKEDFCEATIGKFWSDRHGPCTCIAMYGILWTSKLVKHNPKIYSPSNYQQMYLIYLGSFSSIPTELFKYWWF